MDNILLNYIVDILDILNNILDNLINILDILFQTYEAEEGDRIVIIRTTESLFFSFEACVDLRLRERNREREESRRQGQPR